MTTTNANQQSGFSLLELLVAFTIMAMSLGLIYKSMGASARNVGDITLHQQASMLAESLLNTKDAVTDHGWNESGMFNSFIWHVTSSPFQSAINSPQLIPLHEIRITISWSDGGGQRQLEARTLLPQRKPAPGEAIR